MKKIILSLIISSLFLLVGCETIQESIQDTFQGGSTENDDVLNIELYDAQGNLITGSIFSTGAIVNDVQDVRYISVSFSIKNEGNVNLGAKVDIQAPDPIIVGVKEYVSRQGGQTTCEDTIDGRLHCVLNAPKGILPNQKWGLHSGLVDIEKIGYGSHTLSADATAQYKDEAGQIKYISASSSKIINIQPDPITAGISVDIGTSSSTPPPPCTFECPKGMILSGDKCLGDPISNEPTNMGGWLDTLKEKSSMDCSFQDNNQLVVCPTLENPQLLISTIPAGEGCLEGFEPAINAGDLVGTNKYSNIPTNGWIATENEFIQGMFVFCSDDDNFAIAIEDDWEWISDYFRTFYTCEVGKFDGINCIAEPIRICITT